MTIPPEMVAWAVGQTREWIGAQREARRPDGVPLPNPMTVLFRPFFPAATLDAARVCHVNAIPNPDFLEAARALGFPVGKLDFRLMYGLTVVDTILLSQRVLSPDPLALVFHELVHVVQYEVLGLDEFARQYVEGFLSGGDYYHIPLEVQAYRLEARFIANRDAAFSVLDEVSR